MISHRAQGTLSLHTELRNPRVVSQDDEHPITRMQGVSTDLSSHQETVHGVEADFTAAPSDATSILGLLSASAEAKAGYHRGHAGSADRSTVEQTTQTHKGRAYLVAYDAEHTIGAHTSFDGKYDSGKPFEVVKSVPDAVELWVEASDIRDVGLPPAEVERLAPEDRHGYQDADPTTLKAPGQSGERLGTLEMHRAAALSELVDHVKSELDDWAAASLKGKNPKLAEQFKQLQADVVRQLGERARSGGYSAMMDDARNGGLPLVVTDHQAEGGKRELLVVVRTALSNGRYHDTLPELSTTTSYKVTHDKQAETSNTLSAEATAGASGSSAGFGALAVKAAPALTSRISDLGEKGEDLLDKLPDPLSTQAGDLVDSAKDKLDDTIGDKLSPAFKAEASRRTAQRQGDGDTSTVTMTRTGPAHRFVYDQGVARSSWPLSTQNVHNQKHNDPHPIDEVPVNRQHIQPLRVCLLHMPGHRQRQRDRQHDESDHHVGRVQADQRVKRRTKEIRPNRQSKIMDQVIPLPRCHRQEDHAQQDRPRQTQRATANVVFAQCAYRIMDREAARKQTDCAQDRQL
jgi:hypothetical protein